MLERYTAGKCLLTLNEALRSLANTTARVDMYLNHTLTENFALIQITFANLNGIYLRLKQGKFYCVAKAKRKSNKAFRNYDSTYFSVSLKRAPQYSQEPKAFERVNTERKKYTLTSAFLVLNVR